MANKPTKASKPQLGLAGAAEIHYARLANDAARVAGSFEVNVLALPLARFIILASARKDVSDAERAEFNAAQLLTRGAWTELQSLLDEVKSEPLRNEMTLAIDALCTGVAQLGRFACPADVQQRALESEQQCKQAKVASAGKAKKDNPRRRKLYKAIKEEAEALNEKLSKGLKFAERLRPGVLSRLGLAANTKGWPVARTIKDCIENPPKDDEQDTN